MPSPNASVDRRPSAAIVTRARTSPSNGRPLTRTPATPLPSMTAPRTVHAGSNCAPAASASCNSIQSR